MPHILLITWNGGGNQTPAVASAQALRRAGHQVSFAGYTSQAAQLTKAGFPFWVLSRSDAAWSRRPAGSPVMQALAEGVFACPWHRADIADVLTAVRPDVVLVDCLMLGAVTALASSNVPAAVLVHSAPGALVPPGGPVEAIILGPLNQLRSAAGMPPVQNLWDAWAPFPVQCATLPELEPRDGPFPASFDYIGPILPERPATTWGPPWPATDHRPLILVSFSTGNAWDQTSRIERTLHALSAAPYRVFATTGAADVGGLQTPRNAVLQPYAPHPAVLPHAALTISHGGHGTLSASLAEAVPLVLLPNLAADQPLLAARLAALGAGETLEGDTATPEDISQAVRTVIEGHTYQEAAATLAAAIASANAATAMVRKLEALL